MRSAVTIGIITYNRPGELGRLLGALEGESAGVCEVLVVDNDRERTAETVVKESSLDIRYVCEPAPGTSHARNRLMDECTTPWLASLDDDEVPATGWLDALLRAANEYRADLVAGPVDTEFISEPAQWIVESGFFERPNPATGTVLESIRGGNLLINVGLMKDLGVRYDPDFNRGGQDIQFSLAATALGARIVWTREAPIVEYVGPERLTREWANERVEKTYCNYWRAKMRTKTSTVWSAAVRSPANLLLAMLAALDRNSERARWHLSRSRGAAKAVRMHLQQR